MAHISDLHLLALHAVTLRDFLGKRLTGGFNLLVGRRGQFPVAWAQALLQDVRAVGADHLVVSGDLSNLALPAEFELARRVLSGIAQAIPVTVVPGNHDCYVAESVTADHFGRILAPFLGERTGPDPFPRLRLQGELAVLALSSARPSAPLMAVGTLGSRQIARAERLLTGDACRGRFRVVVLHHPPLPGHVRWHNRLTDAGALRSMLARAGAELVLHGHLHRFLHQHTTGPSGPIDVVGVGSGTWTSPRDPARRAQYNLYEIEARRLVAVRTRQYDPGAGRFVDRPGPAGALRPDRHLDAEDHSPLREA